MEKFSNKKIMTRRAASVDRTVENMSRMEESKMTIRSQAKKTWGGVTANEIKNLNKEDGERFLTIAGQSYSAAPYKHDGDSVHDDEISICDWDDATYIRLIGQYQKHDVWLDCGTDKYND